jgi:hypothetical protein
MRRSATSRPAAGLLVAPLDCDLFLAVEVARGAMLTAWLVPSPAFAEIVGPSRAPFLGLHETGQQRLLDAVPPYAEQFAPQVLRRLVTLKRRDGADWALT